MKLPFISSMSAPKKIGTRDKPIFDFGPKPLSPGVSPSFYAIPNLALASSMDIFFNSSIPISDLQFLGQVDTITEEEFSPTTPLSGVEKYELWISKSSRAKPKNPLQFHKEIEVLKKSHVIKGEELFKETKPPGFEKPWHEYSTESECTPMSIQSLDIKNVQPKPELAMNDVLLKQPPKVGIVKRETRGKFNEEEVSFERYFGKLKFYQLKKRFGFISLEEDGSDVFLCEDDLVLSGVSYKKFKEDVFNKVEMRLEFNIKRYMENEKEKRKAISVKICGEN
jgi:cold shock CspA family protein